MSKARSTYTVEGGKYTLDEIVAEIQKRYPATAPRITKTLLQRRLYKTTRWDKLGECPNAAARRSRDAYRRTFTTPRL